MKNASLFAAGLSLCFGLASAWYWLKSSRIVESPAYPESADSVVAQMNWTAALIRAGEKSARLNKTASILTAIAVVFGAVSSFVGSL
jgi:hypothetical protein